jgi:hypothetical protein
MSYKKSLGFLAASAIASVIAQGCSVRVSSSADSGIPEHKESGAIIGTDDGGGGAEGGALVYDGTTGKQCKTDADCTTAMAGINKCSNDFGPGVLTNVKIQQYATPVCIVPPPTSNTAGNCDPAPLSDPMGQSFHFCDGPDDTSAPGICAPLTNPPTTGLGICLPKCTFALDGTAATGCVGKNACLPNQTISVDANDNATAYGYCQGVCQTDGDCSGLGTGYVCQTDIASCTKTPVKRTKALGAACASDPSKTLGNDSTTGACNCLVDTTTFTGYCTTACLIGGAACPSGYVCDNLQPSVVQLPDGTVATVAKENVGTLGVCMPSCTAVADGGTIVFGDSGAVADGAAAKDASGPVDAGAAPAGEAGTGGCSGSSVCEAVTPVGPNCVP